VKVKPSEMENVQVPWNCYYIRFRIKVLALPRLWSLYFCL